MSSSHRIPFVLILFVSILAASLVGLTADARAAASGARIWAKVVTPVATANDDQVLSVAPGPGGSIYACGVYDYPLFSGYLWVARYSPGGRREWLHKYGESLGIDANASAIAVDGQGDLIVAGEAVVAGNRNALTLKYSPEGTLLWAKQFDGAVSGVDTATAVAVDSAGGIYVAGATTDIGTGLDYLVVKYDQTGHRKWVASYSGPSGDDAAAAITVGAAGSVYVTGVSPSAGGDADCVTAKLSASGSWRWFRRYGSPGGFADSARKVAVGAGGVYVDGVEGSAAGDELLLLKYATGGAREWTRTWDGAMNLPVSIAGLAVDASGHAWVAGQSKGRAVLVKWDAAGHRRWVKIYWASSGSEFADVVVDDSGQAWCAGERINGAVNYDFLVVKYSRGGRQLWLRTWDGSAGGNDGASCLCLSGSGGLYVGGWTASPATHLDPALLKYQR